jgi:hypothetical protein
MKHFVLSLVVLVVLSSTASSQFRFGVQGNLTNVNIGGQVQEIYGLGYGGGVHFDVKAGLFSLRLSGDYVMLNPDKDKYRALLQKVIGSAAAGFTIDGGRINVYSANLNVNLTILPLPIVQVYATGGGGFANLSVTDAKVTYNGLPVTSVPGMKGQTKPTANVGAGVEINLGGVTLFGEAKVNWIMTEGETSTQVPLATIGLTF